MRTAEQPVHDTPAQARPRRKISVPVSFLLGIIAVAFLLGFVPMWWTAQTRGNDLAALSERHQELQLESTLARAALLARQGEYEAAREAASQFFTELNREVIATDDTPLNREALRASLNQRDEVITLLARSDPASADRLTELYMMFRASQPLSPQ